jgi:hypothetical protein
MLNLIFLGNLQVQPSPIRPRGDDSEGPHVLIHIQTHPYPSLRKPLILQFPCSEILYKLSYTVCSLLCLAFFAQ